jgi:hypothetical protein
MSEIVRVSKPGALFLVNEIYSHTLTDRIRYSSIVDRVFYPRMQRFIYGTGKPYVTEDERKLTEADVRSITKPLQKLEFKTYFNFLVARVVPDRYVTVSRIDRLLLIMLKPVAKFLAGRVVLAGHIMKDASSAVTPTRRVTEATS